MKNQSRKPENIGKIYLPCFFHVVIHNRGSTVIVCLSTRRDVPIGTFPNLTRFLECRHIAHGNRRFEGDAATLLSASGCCCCCCSSVSCFHRAFLPSRQRGTVTEAPPCHIAPPLHFFRRGRGGTRLTGRPPRWGRTAAVGIVFSRGWMRRRRFTRWRSIRLGGRGGSDHGRCGRRHGSYGCRICLF